VALEMQTTQVTNDTMNVARMESMETCRLHQLKSFCTSASSRSSPHQSLTAQYWVCNADHTQLQILLQLLQLQLQESTTTTTSLCLSVPATQTTRKKFTVSKYLPDNIMLCHDNYQAIVISTTTLTNMEKIAVIIRHSDNIPCSSPSRSNLLH